ncbi:MAG: collagen-like protein [Candidatus Dependentiae bacterium]|nr:collagen-like protein [Candidatus Dependentiae bacterium]
MHNKIKLLFFLILISLTPDLQSNVHILFKETEINDSTEQPDGLNRKHCCCCLVGPRGPQGLQGPQGPPGPALSREYAYIYSTQNTIIAPGASIPYDQNGPITSGITHSTVSNTDQLIINVTGDYRIQYNVCSGNPMFFAVSVNGVVQTSSQYGSNTGGTILAGSVVLNLSSGDIVRITNYSIGTTTTLSNTSSGNPRISASVTIHLYK